MSISTHTALIQKIKKELNVKFHFNDKRKTFRKISFVQRPKSEEEIKLKCKQIDEHFKKFGCTIVKNTFYKKGDRWPKFVIKISH